MSAPVIGVLDYGMGNLRSVTKALERVGAEARLIDAPEGAGGLDGLVVPGVGAFGACMDGLRERGLDTVVTEWAEEDRPLLGVCLGMQVLFEWSEEGGVEGLGVLAGKVRRLPDTVKVPHMGWNEVRWTRETAITSGVPDGTRFYFVHSYACEAAPELASGETEYGTRFAAAVQRGRLFATQFHPEKSGDPGIELYRAFVESAS
ncbi:MAG: imidazole glycerol phosphate synthase subunit HisH [Actinomycetota bacterium]